MKIAKVIGTVVSTIKHQAFEGKKLLWVQPLDPYKKSPKGEPIIAVDIVQAGIDDIVLVVDEGNAARQLLYLKNAPVRAVVIGIIDRIDIDVIPDI